MEAVPVPVDMLFCQIVSLPDNVPWGDPEGCSGHTKPVNTSLSSPLITDKVLAFTFRVKFVDFLWVSCGFSQRGTGFPFPGEKESPIYHI